jgi:hypothetical protein
MFFNSFDVVIVQIKKTDFFLFWYIFKRKTILKSISYHNSEHAQNQKPLDLVIYSVLFYFFSCLFLLILFFNNEMVNNLTLYFFFLFIRLEWFAGLLE